MNGIHVALRLLVVWITGLIWSIRPVTIVSGKDEKKRLLEEVLSQGGKDRKKAPSKVIMSRKKADRKVNLRWLHFHESTQTYVQVKSQKGGGTRVANLPVLSTRDVIISTGINWFFFQMDPAPLAPQMK